VVNTFSTHVWPLLLSMAQLVLTMWIGVRLLGGRAGLLAGALLAFLPLDVTQAGHLMPDGVMATLLTAAAVLWLAGRDRAGGHSRLLLFLSGVCLALATVTRVYSIVLVVLYVGDVIARPRTSRDLLWPALGGLAVGLPLIAIYQVATGDAFYALRVVSDSYGRRLAPEGLRLLLYPGLLWHPRSETALYPVLFAGALVFALIRRTRAHLLLLLWVLPLLLFLEFGTMSFTRYVPIFKGTRFLSVVAAPLSLLVASMLCAVAPWLRERWRRAPRWRAWRAVIVSTGIVVLLVGVADSLYVLRRDHVRRALAGAQIRAVVALLSSEPDLPVFIDHWRTAHRLTYYFGFREGSNFYLGVDDRARMVRGAGADSSRLRYLAWYPVPDSLPPGLIVLDDAVLDAVARADSTSSGPFFAGEVPAYGYRPPASWRLLRRIGSWRIYLNPPPATSRSEQPAHR
jgi:4-amino-4-deoxy-L-arabinose transferase-like glycosyltransferase